MGGVDDARGQVSQGHSELGSEEGAVAMSLTCPCSCRTAVLCCPAAVLWWVPEVELWTWGRRSSMGARGRAATETPRRRRK